MSEERSAAYGSSALGAGTHVTCLACGGRGHTVGRDYRGVPYPIRCPGCHGTGSQKVVS